MAAKWDLYLNKVIANRFTFFRRYPHFAVFFSCIFISLVVLPHFSRQETYPLFDWRLFDQLGGGMAFDILLEKPDRSRVFLSDGPVILEYWRVPTWRRAQALGQAMGGGAGAKTEKIAELIAAIQRPLAATGLRPVRLVRLRGPLHQYLNPELSQESKLKLVEAVYEFE